MDVLIGASVAAIVGLGAILFTPVRDHLRLWLTRASPTPVRVTVDTATSSIDNDVPETLQFYLPGPDHVTAADPGTPVNDWSRWARKRGGIDIGQSAVLITLQAVRDAAIAIDPPRIRWWREELPAGLAISPEGMGNGADLLPRRFIVEIEAENDRWTYYDPDADTGQSRSFTLRRGETARLLVFVRVDAGLVKWTLELPMVIDGRRELTEITDNNRAFATVGTKDLHFLLWVGDRWISSG